jgi:hypothetical protein
MRGTCASMISGSFEGRISMIARPLSMTPPAV